MVDDLSPGPEFLVLSLATKCICEVKSAIASLATDGDGLIQLAWLFMKALNVVYRGKLH